MGQFIIKNKANELLGGGALSGTSFATKSEIVNTGLANTTLLNKYGNNDFVQEQDVESVNLFFIRSYYDFTPLGDEIVEVKRGTNFDVWLNREFKTKFFKNTWYLSGVEGNSQIKEETSTKIEYNNFYLPGIIFYYNSRQVTLTTITSHPVGPIGELKFYFDETNYIKLKTKIIP